MTKQILEHPKIESAVIVAPGPHALDGFNKIADLDNPFIIAVNRAAEIPGIDYDAWIVADALSPETEWFKNINAEFSGERIFSEWVPFEADYSFKVESKFDSLKYIPPMEKFHPDGSIVGIAIEIAYRLGAKRIYLCGADLSGTKYYNGEETYSSWLLHAFIPYLDKMIFYMRNHGCEFFALSETAININGDNSPVISDCIRKNLDDALLDFGQRYDINAAKLIRLSGRDRHGGINATPIWPTGSITREEGRMLYALTRIIKPQNILEIGTRFGCSATHMAQAIHDEKYSGSITTVDISGKKRIGKLIPRQLKRIVDKVHADICEWIENVPDNSVDLIFEDGGHTFDTTRIVASHARRILKPNGFLIMHDVLCDEVIDPMTMGIAAAGITGMRVYFIEPSAFSVGVWRKEK